MSPRILNKDKTCSAEDCDDPVHACGLCRFHYNADYAAKPENKAKANKRDRERQADPRRREQERARYAERMASEPEFREKVIARNAARSIADSTSPEFKARRDEYKAKPENKARAKAWSVQWNLARYGMTLEDYNRKLAEQGGGCDSCGSKTPGGNGGFHVDHDHECCNFTPTASHPLCGKCVRGLLCNNCNRAAGLLRDSVERVEMLLNYLKKWRLSAIAA